MANWKQALAEATTYGLTGAAGGAPFGGIGAGVAGGAGAIGGFLHGLFQPTKKDIQKKQMRKQQKLFDKKSNDQAYINSQGSGALPTEKTGNIVTGYNPYISTASTLNPAQQSAQSSLLPGITQSLQKPINFQDIENETVRRYERDVLPKISHRFTASTAGKLSSPAHQAALREGGENLQLQLNAQRAKHELEQQQQQGNLLGTLMRPSQENFYNEGTEGIVGSTLPHVSHAVIEAGLPSLLGLFKSNPSAAAQKIQSLDAPTKKALMDYVTTGAGQSAPAQVKDLIAANAKTGISRFLPTSNLGKAGLGLAAAGVTAYGLTKLFNHLLKEEA